MKNEITIIIPNYNGQEIIKKCVNSLFSQSYKDFEIIIIDDASSDTSVEIIKNLPVRLIENKENKGFAYSVNEGIKAAKTDFVLLLNNDVFIQDPDFLKSMLEVVKKNPSIFSVSSKMISYMDPYIIDDTGDEYTLLGWIYKRGNGQYINQYTHDSLIFSTCAGAGLYRRDVFNQIGYFDDLHFAYLEDVDIGWRAQIAGYINVYSACSECYHLGSNTFAQGQKYSNLKVYLSARNNIYIIYKNMPNFQIFINLPFLVTGFLIKILYFLKQGYFKDYLKGLSEGLTTLHKLKRVEFKKVNIPNYKRIQREMIRSTKTYLSLKLRQYGLKIKKKIKSQINDYKERIFNLLPNLKTVL